MKRGEPVGSHQEAILAWEAGHQVYGSPYDGMERPVRLRSVQEIRRYDPENLMIVRKAKKNPAKPPQFPYEYAATLKRLFPDIWAAGGNIRGNDAFKWWSSYRRGNRSPEVVHWWNVTRPAWIARHYQDHRLPGVVAQIKWGTIGTLGVAGMKRVVEDAIRRKG